MEMLQAGFMEMRAKQAVDWVGQQARSQMLRVYRICSLRFLVQGLTE